MPYQTQFHHSYLSTTWLIINIIVTFLFSLNPSFTRAQSSSSSNESYNGSPLPTTAIIIVVVVFGVGIAICYIRHLIACFRGYILGESHNGGGGPRRRVVERGLDPAVIATFPTFSFSDVKLHLTTKTTPLECAICLYEFVDQDLLRLLPTCNHVFHPHCIAPWFASHSTCPVCRANLEIQPESQTPAESSLGHVLQHQRSVGSDDHQPEPSDQEQIKQPHHQGDDQAEVSLQIREEAPDKTMKSDGGGHKSNNNKGGGKRFQRSHSTGHSLVENCERFTLRLPEEVRNKLVNQNVNNNTSNANGLSAASLVSPRFGYRAWSVSSGTGSASMSIKPDRWRFSMSPPFISRPGSSPEFGGCSSNSNLIGMVRSPKSLFKSMKSPVGDKSQLNRVVRCDDIGERSSDKLWPFRTSQELGGLQDH